MAKIVLNTFGSFGDLHPYLAIAIELSKRGHNPVLASSAVYRPKVEAEGITFAAIRPDVGELLGKTEFLKKLWHPRQGSKYLLRDYLLPRVEEAYDDLAGICEGADLLLTHAAAYAGPIVAEVRKLRWISIALQPAIFFSIYDPPVVAPAPWARHLYGLGAWVFGTLLQAARYETEEWARPVALLRRKLGLPAGKNPVLAGQFSPFGTLALFSPHYAPPQRDWPVNTKATGFITYDRRGEGFGPASNADALDKFLAAGSPPVVFTLGSSAVMEAGHFYEESSEAAETLGVRAVLLVGKTEQVPKTVSSSIYVADYAPYSELLPKAAATVHQGGIGTTAQALCAGRPMIIVPWAHDQPDNAERCRKLKVSRTMQRGRYRAGRVAVCLNRLLNDSAYLKNAGAIAARLNEEDGLMAACDAIEANVSS